MNLPRLPRLLRPRLPWLRKLSQLPRQFLWLAHLPLAILPFLAAAAIEGRRLDLSTPFTGPLFLLGFHWFWMVVALALGAWVGWRTAGEMAPQSPPEGGA